MLSRQQLDGIADMINRHLQITIISDEVYEHIVLDPSQSPHIFISTGG